MNILILSCLFCSIITGFIITIRASENPLPLTEKEQAWLEKHPHITFSVDDHYPPFNFRDRTGALVGLTIDYTRLIEIKLGIKITSLISERMEIRMQH